MRAHDVIAERFVVEHAAAGSGGMGVVHRATDRVTGKPVALKLLHPEAWAEAERFELEARLLAELAHPSIVRYVAHGRAEGGRMYLAMEWLEGEDLGARLARAPLTVAESVAIARQAAAGLSAAHAAGVVHRDIKPPNLFLIGRSTGDLRLLDFGVARLSTGARPVTRTGVMVGTVGYMAPEQARGARDLDERADVFSLGCVLFECLTGLPAFGGGNLVEVLARLLREDAPPLRQVRPDIPGALESLVARMLSKERAGRPRDATMVLRELEAIDRGAARGGPQSRPLLTGAEQQLVTVMLLELDADAPLSVRTLTPSELLDDIAHVIEIVEKAGGDVAPMTDGTMLVMLSGKGAPTDQAARAAELALEVRFSFPQARISIATGRADTHGGWPDGPVVDRCTRLLERARASSAEGGAYVDDVTAGLVGSRFALREGEAGRALAERLDEPALHRRVLGKATPCVGRDKEIALLEGTFAEVVDESVARAVVLIGPAGMGKSRLRAELCSRLDREERARIVIARGHPVGSGSALALARQLLRRAAEVDETAPPEAQREKLAAHLARLGVPPSSHRSVDFLGELLGIGLADADEHVRAARDEPRVMGDALKKAFEDWLEAECAAAPTLLVLEDLHWGDLATVMLVGSALRRLSSRPLMVLALARPEIAEVFPGLWREAGAQTVTLSGLTRRAAERLARAVVGDGLDSGFLSKLIDHADGNPFYLEELMRHAASGGEELPETVLSMVQARLSSLDGETRRVLRAASVFGEVCWAGGVAALLGGPEARADVARRLEALVEQEVLVAGKTRRFPGEAEFAFRQDLLREAAYGMLTEADRQTGHVLAGEWLERAGETDPTTLAEHFARGSAPERAVPWLMRAAQRALDGRSFDQALALTARGVALGAKGAALGHLRVIQAQVYSQQGAWPETLSTGAESLELLPSGSKAWFLAAASLAYAAVSLGDLSVVEPVLQALTTLPEEPEPTGPYAFAMVLLIVSLFHLHQRDQALSLMDQLEAAASRSTHLDPAFLGWMKYGRVQSGTYRDENLGRALRDAREAAGHFTDAGHSAGLAAATMAEGFVRAELGQLDQALPMLRRASQMGAEAGTPFISRISMALLARALVFAGRVDEGEALLGPYARADQAPDVLVPPAASTALAEACLRRGDREAAERHARAVLERTSLPIPRAEALNVLARLALDDGRPEQAAGLARTSIALEQRGGHYPSNGSIARLTLAEALFAAGDEQAASEAIREAVHRIWAIAAGVEEPALRGRFLRETDANARTIMLARDWLGVERTEAAR